MSSRRAAYAAVAAAAVVPRLAVLAVERGDIVSSFTEKSWDFAQTFVASGTYGFIVGVPSASTQPLYGFFLVPIVWIFGTSWLAVGLVQTAVAAATALVVYEIGCRVLSRRAALVAALIATLQPYLVWHDVHVNRELLDQLLGAALMLLTLVACTRRTLAWAAGLGAVAGLAILSNTRLVALPLVLAGYLLWARVGPVAAVAVVACAVLVVMPWVVRNRVQVGCFALTTDSKALWKANNLATYDTLSRGLWIDDVPDLPGAPPTPEMAASIWKANHQRVPVDECAQMRLYRGKVTSFWRHHPGEKAKLAAQATWMLWSPAAERSEGGPDEGGGVEIARKVIEPLYMVPVYVLAVTGLFLVAAPFRVLALCFLGYETLAAWVFAGTTRYRVPWDFVLALLAAAALTRLPFPPFRPSSQKR